MFLNLHDILNLRNSCITPKVCIVLRKSMYKLVDLCNLIGLSLNFNKCKVMTFFKTHRKTSFEHSIHNEYLTRIDQIEDLSFTLVLSFSFSIHVEFITCKALRTLGFIRRNALTLIKQIAS